MEVVSKPCQVNDLEVLMLTLKSYAMWKKVCKYLVIILDASSD